MLRLVCIKVAAILTVLAANITVYVCVTLLYYWGQCRANRWNT